MAPDAVAFWNLVGAGLFGFLINPPLSLYYMQGLNLTPLHGHTALLYARWRRAGGGAPRVGQAPGRRGAL